MTTWLFTPDPNADGGNIKGPLDRMAVEQFERAEHRRVAREEMRSNHSSAAEKIRAWEKLHGLQLPRDPNHMVLRLVARHTGLTVYSVIEEQRRRAGGFELSPAT